VARPAGCRVSAQRTKASVEQRVLVIRRQLRTKSDLGEFGPEAIQREMQQRGQKEVPSVATLTRILSRRGALEGRQRVRRTAPPPGWFLPDVADKRAELDSFDAIEDLVIRDGIDVNVLTGISLHGGLCAAWPAAHVTAKFTVDCLREHWREVGLPRSAKFDNGTVFQGAHQWPDSFGRVTRMCLSLKIIPVFAPPLCRGFQADIEAFNRRWQDAVWSRFTLAQSRGPGGSIEPLRGHPSATLRRVARPTLLAGSRSDKTSYADRRSQTDAVFHSRRER
jgi:hypothetical protein